MNEMLYAVYVISKVPVRPISKNQRIGHFRKKNPKKVIYPRFPRLEHVKILSLRSLNHEIKEELYLVIFSRQMSSPLS